MSSANLWATDYLFGFETGSNTRVYLGIPENPGSSGYCTQVSITDQSSLERCIWHCVSSKGGTTASNILSSGSTGSYLYVQVGGTKYWLRTASGSNPIRYTTSSDDSYDFIFNSNGLAENSSTKYYVYLKSNDSDYFYTGSSTSNNLLRMGSSAYVSTTKINTGYVFVAGNVVTKDFTNDKDIAHRVYAKGTRGETTYYLYAKPATGYYFKGWSKSNSFSSIDITATNKSGKDEKTITLNEGTGYHASYYAMFVPYWKFSAVGAATSAGGGEVTATVAQSEIEASDNSSTSSSTTASFTATANPGYEFVGWTDSQTGTTPNQGTDNPKTGVTITNSTPGSTATKTLYAIFKASTYTLHFYNDNPNATGSMGDVTFTLGKDEKIPKNQFAFGFSTTFDANDGGTIDGQPTVTLTSSSYSRWIGNDGVFYNDEDTINKTGITSYTLTTVWHKDSDGSYKAPFNPSTPVCGDREFTGWHWQRYKDNKKAGPGEIVWMYENGKTLFAHYGDPFYAKVNLSKTPGTSGTPTVDAESKSSNNKNADLVFTITAPSASEGYHFTGWTGTNVVFGDSHSTTTTATVKSSTTAGSSNATVAAITANYSVNTYSIIINANGSSSTERVVFNVTGPSNYRLSVKPGESVTLTNMSYGSYTITPEPSWSWNSNVSPSSKIVTFTQTGSSQTLTADFTVTSKGSAKKHKETSSTVTP